MIAHHDFNQIKISAYQQPKKGNRTCGDSYFVSETEEYFICAVADGLGSGDLAKESSEAAIAVIEKHHEEDVQSIMERCNEEMRGKRGSVLTLFKVDFSTRELSFCGIGNINLVIYPTDGTVVRPISYSGYLSGKKQRFKVQTLTYEEGASFIVYSDGVKISSKNQAMITKMKTVRDALRNINEIITPVNDDITFLIGKTN
ncbi:PP2C family serine/threonine-protein phosphatase [Pseudalkalibacillus caeni]|uniref:PPM-type phosphatase domain-containing protein n=1 Tax=Exobacillus caeni TaxID=2574798 RepID=A0A5R9F3B6_9BACL|nr:PP2C family serine/threonine-protein phosphatase [Pseudalkalibacillus caeni]TLS34914.1 hypothetical protein FCL54_23320 [Pseudalkalibacillus caeni]